MLELNQVSYAIDIQKEMETELGSTAMAVKPYVYRDNG